MNSEDNSLTEQHEPLWSIIISKIQPYLTKVDVINLDTERYNNLIKRLLEIKDLTESEYVYAKTNKDIILIRLGLLHNIPEMDRQLLEISLKQLSTRLAEYYYKKGLVDNAEQAQSKVLSLISKSSSIMSLNPMEEIIKLRSKMKNYSEINSSNMREINAYLIELRDKMMDIGAPGQILHEINTFSRRMKTTQNLPTKEEIIESTLSWQAKLKGD